MTSLGELKLEYNNDAMKLKKNVLQAKTHIINNLAKKSKKFKSHKGPDEIKAKFEKKAESCISEIQLIKKVKYNDLVRFAITNNVELSKLMNTPTVTMDKVMAKLLSHKTLKMKIDEIKNKFKQIPASTLLEPNQKKARRKMIKEKRAKKLAAKNNSSSAVEKSTSISENDENVSNNENESGDENESDDENVSNNENESDDENASNNDYESDDENELNNENSSDDENSSNDEHIKKGSRNRINLSNKNKISSIVSKESMSADSESETESNLIQTASDSFEVTSADNCEKKIKKAHVKSKSNSIEKGHLKSKKNCVEKTEKKIPPVLDKNKNTRNKILADLDDVPSNVSIEKTVDSFFVTETGDNYMTMALPRQPDDLRKFDTGNEKSGYSQGNRKMRRAAKFGNEDIIISKKRKPNVDERFGEESRFSKKNNNYDDFSRFDSSTNKRNNQSSRDVSNKSVEPPEKLHPSWQAKKQISSIVGFQGKKTVFDD